MTSWPVTAFAAAERGVPVSTACAALVKVLLVEDDADDREITTELLQSMRDGRRYEVTATGNYDEALAALTAGKHDVCLLDHLLGSWNGFDLLAAATNRGLSVPIVFLTGTGTIGIEQRALAAGAADYLVKGQIDRSVLERSIRHSLERARSVEALRAREHQFRSVFEGANDAMLIIDDDSRYLDANFAAEALFGLTRERLLALRVGDVSPDRNDTRQEWERLLRDGRAKGEVRIRRSDGCERVVEFHGSSGITPGRHLVILRDVTERRAAEEQRVRLAAIVESAADAIETLNLDGVIEYWSASAERLYGYSADEVIGRPKSMLVPEEQRGELAALFERVRNGEPVRDREMLRRRKDGSVFVAAITLSPVYLRGRLVAFSAITRDVSEKKAIEAHLALSDRMASVGTLAAGVAHEINNPLAVVLANLELLASSLGPLCEHEALDDALTAADRIRHVVRDLKLFSRPDEERRGPIDVRRILDSSARMAWNEIRHRATLAKDYGDVPLVDATEARLGQVILNLLVNAAQAIKEGSASRNEIRLATRTDASGNVVIEVTDTGEGIPPDHIARLFEPFFTTKPVGIGTGLGLPICKRIVEEIGGTIGVESVVDRGTTFRVVLPPAKLETRRDSRHPTARVSRPRARVLVIDDDPMIAKAVARSLRAHHDVVAVSTGAEGLLELRAHPYDAILCDMMMPEMTGMAFFERLTVTHPEYAPRVVFLTGGAFTPNARDFLARVSNRVVDKPFTSADLLAIIDEVIVESDSKNTTTH